MVNPNDSLCWLIFKDTLYMAQVCEKCGKGPQTGNNVSHSNKKTLRRFNPNLFEKRIFDTKTGRSAKTKLCGKCLKTMSKA